MELNPQTELALGKAEKLPLGKLHVAQYLVAAILVILSIGLWRLEVVSADNFRAMAEANRIRKVPVMAPRGRLFDREGRLLVDNYPSVSCYLLREQMKDLNADLPMIASGLHLTVEQIEAAMKRFQSSPKYQPIPLKQDITPDEQAFIEAHRNELAGAGDAGRTTQSLSSRRLRGAPDRIRRRDLRRGSEQGEVRLLPARRRGRESRESRRPTTLFCAVLTAAAT